MKRRSVFFAMAALAALALSAPATRAETIVVTDSGNLGHFSLSNTAGTLSLSFDATTQEALQSVNGPTLSPTIPASFFPNPISFTATPSGGGTYSISGAGTLTKTFGTGSDVATLAFTVTSAATFPSPLTGFLNLTGPITSLSANSLSGFDFSNYTKGGTNNLTLTGTNFSGGATTFADVLTTPGTSVTGSGSFSQVAVPEPTSMALLGIGLTGLLTFRRFVKRAFVA